ncbi:MAG: NosD domain-containing protein [Metallosphaera sp.]|uniref:NosD domain-containing protein n=1 Tax=Metallosphaera sp. TaxID=2020860 RepID=UPI00316128F3
MKGLALVALVLISLVVPLTSVLSLGATQTFTTIYILPNGTVSPSKAPIFDSNGVYYVENYMRLTGKVGIVIERGGITLSGSGFQIEGTGGNYGIEVNGVNNVTINSLVMNGFNVSFLAYRSSHLTFQNNFIQNSTYGVVLMDSNYSSISSNTFSNLLTSVNLVSSYFNSVNHNGIEGMGPYGIEIIQGGNNSISGNTIRNGITIEDSLFNSVTGNELISSSTAVNLLSSSYNRISNNTISYSNGISLNSSSHNYVSLNSISSVSRGLVLYDSSYNNVSHNKIVNSSLVGLLMNLGQNNLVEGNEIFMGNTGLILNDSSSNSIVNNSLIELRGGIHINLSSNNVVEGNEITLIKPNAMAISDLNLNESSDGVGVLVSQGYNNEIEDNTIRETYLAFLLSSDSYDVISGNSVTSSELGISLTNSNHDDLTGNRMSVALTQIYLYRSDSNDITKNVLNEGAYGMKFNLSNLNDVMANLINRTFYGLYFYRSDQNEISGNSIYSNFTVTQISSQNYFSNNVLENESNFNVSKVENSTGVPTKGTNESVPSENATVQKGGVTETSNVTNVSSPRPIIGSPNESTFLLPLILGVAFLASFIVRIVKKF